MSDLQCPATIVLVAPDSLGSDGLRRVVARRRLLGVFVAAPLAADPGAARLAEMTGNSVDILTAADGPALRDAVDDLSDLHRGETISVVAPPAMIADALGLRETPGGPVVIAIDSSGWTVLDDDAR